MAVQQDPHAPPKGGATRAPEHLSESDFLEDIQAEIADLKAHMAHPRSGGGVDPAQLTGFDVLLQRIEERLNPPGTAKGEPKATATK